MTINTASPILRVSARMSTDPDMPKSRVDHIKSVDPRLIHTFLCEALAGELQNFKKAECELPPTPMENSIIIFNVVMDDVNYPVLLYVEFERMYEDRPVFNGMFFFLDQNHPLIGGELPPKQGGHIFETMEALSLAGQEFAELSAEAFVYYFLCSTGKSDVDIVPLEIRSVCSSCPRRV